LEAVKETEYIDPEDREEYAAANIFWAPKEARWDTSFRQAPSSRPLASSLMTPW